MILHKLARCVFGFAFLMVLLAGSDARAKDLRVLFLGDNGHHQPRVRFGQLQPVFAKRGIQLIYTNSKTDLNAKTLAKYDALLLYANIDRIEPDQEKALLAYVAGGGAFVPLHCATYCFRNAEAIVALMGAQFRRHGTGVFRATIAKTDHPIMKNFGGFESWDETYVHHLHNEKNRTVLEYRVDKSGREPWTWVRTHGKGRVFYTAWGHDARTWGNAGFQNLLERGLRWAAGDDPALAGDYLIDRPFPVPTINALRKDVKPFEFIDVGAEIPNYTPSAKWGTQGKRLNMMQKPLAPNESLKHLAVPQGFHVELFAAEPDLKGKPLCMAWDERGRLWVAESYDYPNQLQPPGKGRDRIRILEDTDGDWKADKFTVFAEHLSIPTSITFHRGGVIVQNGIETLYLKDTDGDDKADQRRVLFSNWQLGDTHGGVSNFRYGLDNWVWAMQGYNNSAPVVKGAKTQQFRMGFFRFRPDGSEIEFIRSTNNNTWGLGISEEGLIFGSTANRNPSVFMPIPNRYYESVRGWAPSLMLGSIADTHLFKPITNNIRQVDQHGGYTAAAGHALYTAREYPQEYWNRVAFVNGPTGHLVGSFVLKRDGSGFRSSNPFNLLASDDEWVAPIMSEVGPDGHVWTIDWYNYIVQHNPTPRGFKTGKGLAYETKLRDKKHGRIYRVVYGDGKQARQMSLADASPMQLVRTLKHSNMLWRQHAQRLLVERGKDDVVPALIELVRDVSVDSIGLNTGVIHALWTLQGLGALDGSHPESSAAVAAALKHPSAGVRRNAVQVLPSTITSVEALIASGILDDSNPNVRLAAMLALADLPATEESGKAVFAAMSLRSNAGDRWILDAATSAAAKNSRGFLAAVSKEKRPSDQITQVSRIVASHFARGDDIKDIPQVVASLKAADSKIADAVINGLNDGWPKQRTVELTPAFERDLEALLARLSPGVKGVLVRMATSWGSNKFEKYADVIWKSLLVVLRDNSKTDANRVQAARQLVEFRSQDAKAVETLLAEVSPRTPPAVATGIIRALELNRAPTAGRHIVDAMRTMTPVARASAIAVLLKRPESTRALLAGVKEGKLELDELSLDQKQVLANHPNRQLRESARKLLKAGGALPNADRQKVLESLMAVAKQSGDPAKGKLIYMKHCSKCHQHSGEGTRVGPDLTGMAVHPKEQLLTHIIDPSRNVEGNFRVYSVVTEDGLVLSGMLASESKTAIELIDVQGKKRSILREQIEQIIASRKSIMPEGFEKDVTRRDLTDLLEFLTHRGQYVPVDLSKAATIASDRGMFNSREGNVERLIFPNWSPKTVKHVPFHLIDPNGGRTRNVILLHGPNGSLCRTMPKSVTVACNGPARAIHLLSGVSGWGYPYGKEGDVAMTVRLHYADGKPEDHPLLNGIHFADYIRRVDVPKSELAFMLRGQQIRYLAIYPKRADSILRIEFVKGPDRSAPVVMAVTIESR